MSNQRNRPKSKTARLWPSEIRAGWWKIDYILLLSYPSIFTQNSKATLFILDDGMIRCSDNLKTQTQPVTWGKVRVTDRNAWTAQRHAATGLMICLLLVNDHTAISCSGWFSSPPWGSGWHDSGFPRCHWSASQPIILTRSGWLPPCLIWPSQGPVESNSMRQKNYLVRPREKGCQSLGLHFGELLVQRGARVGMVNVTNEAVENRFRKHNSNVRGVTLLLSEVHSFMNFLRTYMKC